MAQPNTSSSEDAYTLVQRRILTFIENKDAEVNPTGDQAPTLFAISDIHDNCGGDTNEVNAALFDLEVMQILTHDTHNGLYYYGFRPEIVSIEGIYTIDPDLLCNVCGKAQSTACLTGACA